MVSQTVVRVSLQVCILKIDKPLPSTTKTKYMVMSRDQNAGRNHTVRIDNSTFERVEDFKYLGTTLTNENSILEEIKSRLKSGNACYHSV